MLATVLRTASHTAILILHLSCSDSGYTCLLPCSCPLISWTAAAAAAAAAAALAILHVLLLLLRMLLRMLLMLVLLLLLALLLSCNSHYLCSALAVFMQCSCSALQCSCSAHAVLMQCSCSAL